MMEWKPVLLPVFLAAGLVITGLSTPASADQGRGGWGRNDQPRGDIKPRRFEQDAARRAMLDGQVMPFSIIKRRVEREMDGANYLGSEFDTRRGENARHICGKTVLYGLMSKAFQERSTGARLGYAIRAEMRRLGK